MVLRLIFTNFKQDLFRIITLEKVSYFKAAKPSTMKFLSLLFFLPLLSFSQTHTAQLVNVEVGKQIGISGEAGTPKDMANLAFFPGFNLTPQAESLDQFLREEYLPNYALKLLSKSQLLENKGFQEFKSPYFKERNSGTDASGQHRNNALTGAYNWANGYVPWTYKTPLTDGYDDFPAVKELFPEVDIFVTAELGFSYIIDSDPSISPVLILEFRRTSNQAHKKLYFTTFVEIPSDSQDAILMAPPDADVTMEELAKTLDPLFEIMKKNVEHDSHKIAKFLTHN